MIKFLDLQKVNSQFTAELHAASACVIDSGWYLQGKEVEAFEQEYARYIGTRYCVTCGNGLDALTVMLKAYIQLGKLKEGDEVIVPANTFLATVLSITENHLVPILVEPRTDNLQIDDTLLEQQITPKTRAILLVHLYGICSYTDRVGELCKKHDLLLLEDNAQAHGCVVPTPSGKKLTGSIGGAAAHSFYPGKNLGALGDSGAITTDDQQLATTIRSICNYGFTQKYHADQLGCNSRMDEIQAAFLRVKLQHLDESNAHRKMIADYYISHIHNPHVIVPKVESVFHIFTIFCKYRNPLQAYLASQGVQTLIHYPVPPHLQKCYPELNRLTLPVTERLSAEELSLPISPVITLEEAAEVVRLINAFSVE